MKEVAQFPWGFWAFKQWSSFPGSQNDPFFPPRIYLPAPVPHPLKSLVPHHPSSPERHFLPCTFIFFICSFKTDLNDPNFQQLQQKFFLENRNTTRSLENGKEGKHLHLYFFYSYCQQWELIHTKILHCSFKILFTLFLTENLTLKEPTYYTLIQIGILETHKITFLRKVIQIYVLSLLFHL